MASSQNITNALVGSQIGAQFAQADLPVEVMMEYLADYAEDAPGLVQSALAGHLLTKDVAKFISEREQRDKFRSIADS